jgi:UDP-N-acetylglucosamine acyltransferase
MGNTIHSTAILEGDVRLGSGNLIGPYVVMRGDITIGNDNIFDAGVCISNKVIIGNNNHIYPHATIGDLGEMGLKGDRFVSEGNVIIGDKVTVREYVCIHSPVYTRETRIHDQVYLMNKSYVAHDCVIGQGSVLSAGALLGGRVILEEGVTIGMGATVHQRCNIGCYAMIGMLAPVTRDILPYSTIAGNPARIIGFNKIGAERQGVEAVWMEGMNTFFEKELHVDADTKSPLIQAIMAFWQKHPDALVQWRKGK